jgi:uncharacterized protein (TIGR00297 family)
LVENALSSTDVLRILAGFAGAVLISFLAIRIRALSISGAFVATMTGTLATAAGWGFAIVLIGFFASAVTVSKFRSSLKDARLAPIVAKGGARDAFQVLANGAVFAIATAWAIVSENPAASFAAIGALAGASADTWATEIGSLSRTPPRFILTGRPVPTGTSGAVTILGLAAAVAGATVIGLLSWGVGFPTQAVQACVIAGLAGACADSLAGATVQSRRWCGRCNASTERKVHGCGAPTTPASGISWMDNDAVNFICTLVSAGVGALWVL